MCGRLFGSWWRRVGCLAILAGLASPGVARAQATPAEKAAAEALFDQGLELMRKGKLDEACDKLEKSQRIERGIGTMLYLAECYEKTGRTASAWALFREAASAADAEGQAERARAGRARAKRLEPKLSKLTISLESPDLEGLEIERNAEPVRQALWGVAVPVDPGKHRIVARAPGYESWSETVTVAADAASVTVSIPALPSSEPAETAETEPPVTQAPAEPPPPALDRSTEPEADPTSAGAAQRLSGLIIGGAGVVGLGVGGYFGVRAISKNDDAEAFCPQGGRRCTDARGVTLTDEANSAARLANAFVISGAVLAAGGVVLYLTAPSGEAPSVSVTTDGRGARLTWGGAF